MPFDVQTLPCRTAPPLSLGAAMAEVEALAHEIEENGGELTPELEQRWDAALSSERDAVDRFVARLEALDTYLSALERWKKQIKARLKTVERIQERLEKRALVFVEQCDGKLLGHHSQLSVYSNGGQQAIHYEFEFAKSPEHCLDVMTMCGIPPEFVEKQTVWVLRKTQFDAAVRQGEVAPSLARLLPRGKRLVRRFA